MYKLSQIPEEYKKKLITAEQAAALVKDGDRVSYGLGCASLRPSSKMNLMPLISIAIPTNKSVSQRLI